MVSTEVRSRALLELVQAEMGVGVGSRASLGSVQKVTALSSPSGVTFAAKGYFDALVKMGELASESQGSKELGKTLGWEEDLEAPQSC